MTSPTVSPVHQAAASAVKKGRQSKKKKKRPPSAYDIDTEESSLPLHLEQAESFIKM